MESRLECSSDPPPLYQEDSSPWVNRRSLRSRPKARSTLALVVALCVVFGMAAGVVTLLLSRLHGSAATATQAEAEAHSELRPGSSGGGGDLWLVCSGLGECGQRARPWNVHPAELAHLADLASAPPGVDASAWELVASEWDATPPQFRGERVALRDVVVYVRQLLVSDPFGTGGNTVPQVDFAAPGEGKVVVVTQRQLAFVVANVLMGNTVQGGDGLSALLGACTAGGSPQKALLRSLLVFIAVLSRELAEGDHGTTLVALTPRTRNDASWKQRLLEVLLEAPMFCGRADAAACEATNLTVGRARFEAFAGVLPARVSSDTLCVGLGTASAVLSYSEVLAFGFFTSSKDHAVLPTPWALLGARRYLRTAGAQFDGCEEIPWPDSLNGEISTESLEVPLQDRRVRVASSSFVAVSSGSSTYEARADCTTKDIVNHNCDFQRRHLDDDMGTWYHAFDASMYNDVAQEAFHASVRIVGAGHWSTKAGRGDSQQFWLAAWLATSLLHGSVLDYYVWDHVCRSEGSQCFLHGAGRCKSCVAASGASPVDARNCGGASFQDMVARFAGQPAAALYGALKSVGKPPDQVFDLLARGPALSSQAQ